MTSQSFTEQERADLIQGLKALIHRLRHKIQNDECNDRKEFRRVQARKLTCDRARVLIEKLTENGQEKEVCNRNGERRLQPCS